MVTRQISQIDNMIMVQGYCRNFVSAHRLVNKLIELIYALVLTRSRLGWLRVNFLKFTTQSGPWLLSFPFIALPVK